MNADKMTPEQVGTPPIIEIHGLSRSFGKTVALDNVTLSIPQGGVFGLVGENGAGKTTLIRHILGLLRCYQGSVRVFGFDPVEQPEAVLARIGYLSEDRDLPSWMKVKELMRYTRAFYPAWDIDYAEKLRRIFDLDPHAKIGTLSRGQKAKAGLLAALAHRPDLLLLDEPSSGLDALARRDILTAVIRTAAEEGRTVLFSSHLLNEVERVADRVAMIVKGKVAFCATMEDIKAGHHLVVANFPGRVPDFTQLPGLLSSRGSNNEWSLVFAASAESARAITVEAGGEVKEVDGLSLEDVFLARVGRPVEWTEV